MVEQPSGVTGRRATVIGLVASAGGLEALTTVLRALGPDFPAAIVAGLHLSGQGSQLVPILSRRTTLPVVWAEHGARLAPGVVTVCPARKTLEILPDGTCALLPAESATRSRPLDLLLQSLADCFGEAASAVVLTGMGQDGARGARAVRDAGGFVIAQSEDTAEHPGMPRAAREADAASLVLPLHEISSVLSDVAAGRELQPPRSELQAVRAVFGVHGAVAESAARLDWARTPVGPVSAWSPVMRAMVQLAMACPDPTVVFWSDDLLVLVNEAVLPVITPRGAADVLCRPYRDAFPEAWSQAAPMLRHTLGGNPQQAGAVPFRYLRDGQLRDTWADVSDTPIREHDGSVVGVHRRFAERTADVLAARRLETLNALARAPRGDGRQGALREALDVLGRAADVPFAAAYLIDASGERAELVGAAGAEPGGVMAPLGLRMGAGSIWPVQQAVEQGAPVLVDDLVERFRGCTVGDDRLEPVAALVRPLRDPGDDRVTGALILAAHPFLPYDEQYQDFLTVASETISARTAEAHARRRERTRLEQLAELDRAKTEFFSNVSHEFRTPLTLMLGPLEAAREQQDALPGGLAAELDVAWRNARRLLRLTGSLLDFSEMESGRLHPHVVPTDLARVTREVVAQFEAVAASAGLRLRTAVEPLPHPVRMDPEMWEKIVANLLSNALKFTFEGEIEVSLRPLPKHVELTVRDTGVGIPDEELPFVFRRFHRIRGSRSRSHEGAGIGLSLVDELVRRHHGRVRVVSTLGEGTTFTVWIPLRTGPGGEEGRPVDPPEPHLAAVMAEEARQWSMAAADGSEPAAPMDDEEEPPLPTLSGARILVADDNRDMREYLVRLLGPHWTVEAVGDGAEALATARRTRPDLIVADVMMPQLDGFGLLRELRADERLRTVPVLLVTARAGEESAVEGLLAGADDYVVKPFGGRELVARVSGQLRLARLRRSTAARDRFLLRLSDALRPLVDPHEIMAAAARVLAEHLGVDRVAYGEVTADGEALVIERDHVVAGAESLVGIWRFTDFPMPVGEIREGFTFTTAEVAQDDRFAAAGKAALAATGSAAICTVPLLKEGRFVACLSLHHSTPRAWSEDEITLIEDVAERTWATLERARAEARLQHFAALTEASPVVIAMSDPDLGLLYLNATGRRTLGLEDLDGVSLPDLFAGNGAATPDGRDVVALARSHGRAEADLMLRNASTGATLPASCSLYLLDGGDRRTPGFALVARSSDGQAPSRSW